MNMKKKLILPLVACAALMLASCDGKLCYCYESTAQGVYESELYLNSDTPCNSMSTTTRGCVESNERMSTGDIAYK